MTQQYLAGELSVRLALLRDAAPTVVWPEIDVLRHQAETEPLSALTSVVDQAIALANALCWDCVTRGDLAGFDHEASVAAEIFEFSVCSGLSSERRRGRWAD